MQKLVVKGASMAIQHQYDDEQTDGLFINLVPELRRRLKLAAAQQGLSLREYVERLLEQAVPSEETPPQIRSSGLNRAAVENLLRTREAIMRAHPGQVFEDSAETLRQIREERMRELEQR